MTIRDRKNNSIIIKGSLWQQLKNLLCNKYKIEGYSNRIIIENNVKLCNGEFIVIGDRNYISIGKDSELKNFVLRTEIKSKILIDNNIYFGGGYIHAMDYTKIRVGEGCMFSHDIDIRSGDGHAIYFENMDLKYNKSKDIIIGKHVWVGVRVQILKGVSIEDNCIIGASSVVNKTFKESNCIIAGYPAKIIKRNVKWKR